MLGVAPDAGGADVKKRYWRLSLLVHPDKCGHARAHDAFQAVSKAAKELQVSDASGVVVTVAPCSRRCSTGGSYPHNAKCMLP